VARGETDATCGSGCEPVATERNRYFTGKYMTARDFSGEQHYFLGRHRLHNRLLHGWGVVCGLRVEPHPRPECAERWVMVRRGIGIDCCGREIILAEDRPLEILPEQPSDGGGHAPPPPPGPWVICLRYEEEPIEHVPVLTPEAGCDPSRTEANRIREIARLEVVELDDLDPGCWPARDPDAVPPCRDDCGDDAPGPGGGCMEPDCPCGGCVPLALVRRDPGYGSALVIDSTGRPALPPPADWLTHIVDINWPHGGDMSLAELEAKGGRLEVRFDRPLAPAPGEGDPAPEATGINEQTFVVQWSGGQRDLEFLPFLRDCPPTLEDPCLAVFTIDPGLIDVRARRTIGDSTIHVTLRCDVILDCHGNPVDGNHLRGTLPSGDGIQGGTFESWFRVSFGGGAAKEEE
jgi:hypothetical protein